VKSSILSNEHVDFRTVSGGVTVLKRYNNSERQYRRRLLVGGSLLQVGWVQYSRGMLRNCSIHVDFSACEGHTGVSMRAGGKHDPPAAAARPGLSEIKKKENSAPVCAEPVDL
jgi:hypothetical protein